MDIHQALALLGGLSPTAFMKRHWQKKPLLVRQAWPGVRPPLGRAEMFALAARDDVESRLVERIEPGAPAEPGAEPGQPWRIGHGPFARRDLPPVARPGWTLLVQGLDLHVPAARAMLERFRFIPDARLDDLMMSWASPGGGVGPHIDAYDVFLLQVQGRRRWRVGPVADDACIEGLPLKLLRHFEPEHEWLLEPGDLLYLPPLWGHDGVAVGGDSVSCSTAFRLPTAADLARDLLQRLADEDDGAERRYRDRRQAATETPAAIPAALVAFAQAALKRRLAEPHWLERALGESLTEPKPLVWFEAASGPRGAGGVRLDARTRMLYDERHVFINGEAFRASGRDAQLVRRLADERQLTAVEVRRLSKAAVAQIDEWVAAGWAHAVAP
jgi:50S ribosomal protein L16 3-hydroxylase